MLRNPHTVRRRLMIRYTFSRDPKTFHACVATQELERSKSSWINEFRPESSRVHEASDLGARSELMGHLRNAQELTDQHQELTGQPGARGAVPPAALELTGRLAPGRLLLGDCWGGPALAFPELFRSGVQPTVEQGRLAARSPARGAQRAEPSGGCGAGSRA